MSDDDKVTVTLASRTDAYHFSPRMELEWSNPARTTLRRVPGWS